MKLRLICCVVALSVNVFAVNNGDFFKTLENTTPENMDKDLKTVETLLRELNSNTLIEQDTKNTAYHKILWQESVDMTAWFKLFLKYGLNFNIENDEGTPLFLAARLGSEDAVKFLLDNGTAIDENRFSKEQMFYKKNIKKIIQDKIYRKNIVKEKRSIAEEIDGLDNLKYTIDSGLMNLSFGNGEQLNISKFEISDGFTFPSSIPEMVSEEEVETEEESDGPEFEVEEESNNLKFELGKDSLNLKFEQQKNVIDDYLKLGFKKGTKKHLQDIYDYTMKILEKRSAKYLKKARSLKFRKTLCNINEKTTNSDDVRPYILLIGGLDYMEEILNKKEDEVVSRDVEVMGLIGACLLDTPLLRGWGAYKKATNFWTKDDKSSPYRTITDRIGTIFQRGLNVVNGTVNGSKDEIVFFTPNIPLNILTLLGEDSIFHPLTYIYALKYRVFLLALTSDLHVRAHKKLYIGPAAILAHDLGHLGTIVGREHEKYDEKKVERLQNIADKIYKFVTSAGNVKERDFRIWMGFALLHETTHLLTDEDLSPSKYMEFLVNNFKSKMTSYFKKITEINTHFNETYAEILTNAFPELNEQIYFDSYYENIIFDTEYLNGEKKRLLDALTEELVYSEKYNSLSENERSEEDKKILILTNSKIETITKEIETYVSKKQDVIHKLFSEKIDIFAGDFIKDIEKHMLQHDSSL